MYASHNKDINRHKSFHPLTYRNLSKVEQRQEAEAARKKALEERSAQLRKDQEQRRYDDLVLMASGDSVGGQLAKFRQVENIFAAELATETLGGSGSVSKGEGAGKTDGASQLPSPLLKGGSLTFCKEEQGADGLLRPALSNGPARKRSRGEDGNVSDTAAPGGGRTVTGFVSSADAAQLRKELDRIQKERHDPLKRVEQFQNRAVAAEAKRRALEAQAAVDRREDSQKDFLRSRIQELLDMKKK
ncbi:N terminal domain [Trypanosoma vivax]|uniref:CBF1-interacting co-repressor CIR N-terminal domain-containing protein n=1 Tax=Trypanosoma vivax (strain Y486) TaxID=1055687 RepID=G0UAB6_TRYVY|nr:hypothetical protein TRVL_04899 [Trypanosoma vivax]KAH8617899.1 N terminal domain [Trypanosoma vivax]CCC52749.1 conserved hypothetical protein [Trypanosoma vivax Y486]